MAPVTSIIVGAVVAFTAFAFAHPPPEMYTTTTTTMPNGIGVDGTMDGSGHAVSRRSNPAPSASSYTVSVTMTPGSSHMPPPLDILAGGPLEKPLKDGAPPPMSGDFAYCHTTATSPKINLVEDAVAFFASLNKQACQNKPDHCLNMLSLPGGNKVDIRVWTCGPGEDSTDCSKVAPILTQLMNNCTKDFTEKGKDGNSTIVKRVGGVAWLSPANSAWISLEGKTRE